jgi:hypothetical protein
MTGARKELRIVCSGGLWFSGVERSDSVYHGLLNIFVFDMTLYKLEKSIAVHHSTQNFV